MLRRGPARQVLEGPCTWVEVYRQALIGLRRGENRTFSRFSQPNKDWLGWATPTLIGRQSLCPLQCRTVGSHSLERLKSITVLGGSVATSFKEDQSKSWPHLLRTALPAEIDFRVETRSGLTFVRAITELADFPDEDLLVLHFGTSIGWPISLVKMGHKLGIDFTSEFGFHQSTFVSHSRTRRLKRVLKARFRNTVKYALYFTGLYRSRISRREIADQIDAVIRVAKHQSKRIMWIQHQTLRNRRIFLERRSYERYYKEIVKALERYKSPEFTVITLPDSFLRQENYLLDCVHLSEAGHRQVYEIVREAFKNG